MAGKLVMIEIRAVLASAKIRLRVKYTKKARIRTVDRLWNWKERDINVKREYRANS